MKQNLLLLLGIHTTFSTAKAEDGAGRKPKNIWFLAIESLAVTTPPGSVLLFVVQLFSAM